MLDWDRLIPLPEAALPTPGEASGTGVSHPGSSGSNLVAVKDADDFPPSGEGPEVSHLSHLKSLVSHFEWDASNPVTARLADDFTGPVPLVPLKKHKRGKRDGEKQEKREDSAAGSAVCRQDFCAGFSGRNDVHPAAVLLVLAWSRYRQITREERAELLIDLANRAPAEQVRHWHDVCRQEGLRPWQLLYLPASLTGADCTRCRHLLTRQEALGTDRVRYHWACDLGYLILETGRGTERIWVAPQECQSFERWYPSDWR
jgi:hypothetical protein